MKMRFWGVRGSIPAPGPHTVRYGGNTTCIEVRPGSGERIILDAGTGLFPLAQSLLSQMPVTVHLFLTHTHWDHIQGLPFFIPLFVPGNRVVLHGAFDPVGQRELKEILSRQMEYSYFPVREVELKADIEYVTLREGQEIQVGECRVSNILMSHPVLNFGYRLEAGGKSLFFTGDHEPPLNIYPPEDPEHGAYGALLEERERMIVEFMRGVDVLVADSAYTVAEYEKKKGWGHGTFDSCLELAHATAARHLFFTHHEPTRSDDHLERLFQETLAARKPRGLTCHLAREGLEFEW